MAEVTVSKNEADSRFEAFGGGQLLGYIDYGIKDGVMDLPHTKVFPEFEAQGIGSKLVQQSLDMIREEGGIKVKPTCPFIDIWIRRHKDYQDLVAS